MTNRNWLHFGGRYLSVIGTVALALGCATTGQDEGALGEVQSAVVGPSSDVLGFETLGSWSTTTAGAQLALSTTHTQGSFSLAVHPASSNGYTPLVSASMSTLSRVSPQMSFDIMLPSQQPNPYWFGTLQIFMNCPSRGIYNAFLQQVELTGKPVNTWTPVTFAVTNDEISKLLTTGYSDLTFTVVLNVPTPDAGTYLIDNLSFVPVPANGCGGLPNGTACDDGNACTLMDSCQNGVCQAGPPVVCAL